MNDAPAILLFDDKCLLCNGAVQWILERDARGSIHFAALESKAAHRLLAAREVATEQLPDSLVLVDEQGVHVRSEAALRVAMLLGPPWSWARIARMLPRRIRDTIYSFVARHRYRVFGKTESCLLPAPELRDRFLDQGSA